MTPLTTDQIEELETLLSLSKDRGRTKLERARLSQARFRLTRLMREYAPQLIAIAKESLTRIKP